MAVGDQVVGGTHGAINNATLNIQPGAGVEWLITTVGATNGGSLTVNYAVDGANFVAADVYASGGTTHGLQWRLTNSVILQLKNTSGGSADIWYMGVVTK
jgi:hypothetical protein